jgi:hypothetical protein
LRKDIEGKVLPQWMINILRGFVWARKGNETDSVSEPEGGSGIFIQSFDIHVKVYTST